MLYRAGITRTRLRHQKDLGVQAVGSWDVMTRGCWGGWLGRGDKERIWEDQRMEEAQEALRTLQCEIDALALRLLVVLRATFKRLIVRRWLFVTRTQAVRRVLMKSAMRFRYDRPLVANRRIPGGVLRRT